MAQTVIFYFYRLALSRKRTAHPHYPRHICKHNLTCVHLGVRRVATTSFYLFNLQRTKQNVKQTITPGERPLKKSSRIFISVSGDNFRPSSIRRTKQTIRESFSEFNLNSKLRKLRTLNKQRHIWTIDERKFAQGEEIANKVPSGSDSISHVLTAAQGDGMNGNLLIKPTETKLIN